MSQQAEEQPPKDLPSNSSSSNSSSNSTPKPKKANKKASKKPAQASFNPNALENPDFIQHRIQIWDQLMAEQQERQAALERKEIKVTLRKDGVDGDIVTAVAHEATPYTIAASIAQGLANQSVAAKVDGQIRDLHRPLDADCVLELLKFDDKEAQDVFWHSSAHILGQALEKAYGAHLVMGPPIEEGFFYDVYMPDGSKISNDDFDALQKVCQAAIKDDAPFERLVLTRDQALDMFQYNKFKQQTILDKVPEGETCTAYRCGDLIDLCRGPHVPRTGKIKHFWVRDGSAAYYKGDAKNEQLQRVYGVSFPDKKLMKQCKQRYEEAEMRNHRNIGKQQELFFFNTDYSPGSCFFLPHGTRIVNKLLDLIKAQYRKRGFTEVMSPNMFDAELWKISGHWDHYRDDMFTFQVEEKDWGIKPMNCPGHCLIFGARKRSYRELPMRLAEFGVLHRNEASGTLTGLTRVRRFVQDDAHIFCRPDQIEDEVAGAIDFLQFIYTQVFNFEFELELSTKPEKAVGGAALWDFAETELENALNSSGFKWALNPGDGAFYGPKIDIKIKDALGRRHQCATIQLDFQLPQRFKLEYQRGASGSASAGSSSSDNADADAQDIKGKQKLDGDDDLGDDFERPVIIHRAIYGSFERFVGILCEDNAGKWPFWLSPRQAAIIPITDKSADHCVRLARHLSSLGFYVDADVSSGKMQKKVRDAQMAQYNYMLVVGEKEMPDGDDDDDLGSVNVRIRDSEKARGVITVAELIDEWNGLVAEYK